MNYCLKFMSKDFDFNYKYSNFVIPIHHMIDVKKIIEEEGVQRKFQGCAPEGFILVHEKTLEDLKDFDIWKKWKNNEIFINVLNQINFKNE